MKDHYGLSVTRIFNLCDYNIKPNDVCWNKVKMTNSNWISCCHRTTTYSWSQHQQQQQDTSSRQSSYYNFTGNGSFGGRKFKWSPSVSSENSIVTNSNSNSSPASLSSAYGEWTNSTQSINNHSSSPSMTSSSSTFQYPKRNTIKIPSKNFGYDLHNNTFGGGGGGTLSQPPKDYREMICVITLINPSKYILINCETNIDTECAQINPEREIVAVSNPYWLAFYSIHDNQTLGTVKFPDRTNYWTWINSDTVGLITEHDVYHWKLGDNNNTNVSNCSMPRLIFSLDDQIKNNQIVNYCVDQIFGRWCAVTTLFVDDDGQIGGKIQIFSTLYGQSQCIDGHACRFVSYRFEGNADHDSNVMIVVERENRDLWKLYIIDLTGGPFKNRPLKTQKLMSHALQVDTGNGNAGSFDDIPTQIDCDTELGLIFIVSKYGSFYICDLETGVPLYYDSLMQWSGATVIFSISYDCHDNRLYAVCRNGQVMVLNVLIRELLENKNVQKNHYDIYMRINAKLKHKLPIKNQNKTNNKINGVTTTITGNLRTVSVQVNQKQLVQETRDSHHNHHYHHQYNNSVSSHNDSATETDDQSLLEDVEEEVTRL